MIRSLQITAAFFVGVIPTLGWPASVMLTPVPGAFTIPGNAISTGSMVDASSRKKKNVNHTTYVSTGSQTALMTLVVVNDDMDSKVALSFYKEIFPLLNTKYVETGLLRLVAVKKRTPNYSGVIEACISDLSERWRFESMHAMVEDKNFLKTFFREKRCLQLRYK